MKSTTIIVRSSEDAILADPADAMQDPDHARHSNEKARPP